MQREQKYSIIENAEIGESATIYDQVNLYKCKEGEGTKIDAFVYIEEGVEIGKNCKIRPFVFIPSGVKITNVDEKQRNSNHSALPFLIISSLL